MLAYQRIVDFNVDLSWAGLALGLAAVNVFAAERMERYRDARGLEISLGFYAAAAVACARVQKPRKSRLFQNLSGEFGTDAV